MTPPTATRPPATRPPQSTNIEAARLLIDKLGVSPQDLLTVPSSHGPAPTFAEYIPAVEKAASAPSAATWKNYWRILSSEWGDRRLNEPRASEFEELANRVQENSAKRANSRGGYGAKSSFVDAIRYLYQHAVADKIMVQPENPTATVKRPRRHRSLRRALSANQLAEINHVAATTGADPHLDALLLRLHTETACRRGGALALRRYDLNEKDSTILLHEKGATTREQPVSPTLMHGLLRHVERRNPAGLRHEQLLRNKDGAKMHSGRYDALWRRLGQHLPWVTALGITAHWIRYTTLTWVERNFGYAVAAGYAGHAAGFQTGSTLTYVSATIEEIATALSTLTGEPHPLSSHSA